METETKADPSAYVMLGDKMAMVRVGCTTDAVLRDPDDQQMILLDREALQQLAQWAYDRYGILAAPSYDVEAERAPELDPLQMIHDHVNKAHAQQAENLSGARALGYAVVNGADL